MSKFRRGSLTLDLCAHSFGSRLGASDFFDVVELLLDLSLIRRVEPRVAMDYSRFERDAACCNQTATRSTTAAETFPTKAWSWIQKSVSTAEWCISPCKGMVTNLSAQRGGLDQTIVYTQILELELGNFSPSVTGSVWGSNRADTTTALHRPRK